MATIATLSVLLEAKGQRRFLGDLGKASAAVAAVVVATDRLLDRGGKVTTVTQAFTRRVGDQSVALRDLRAATVGLIGDYDLMRQANTALQLGAAENTEQFAEMARGAQVLGRALGIDAAFALESLTTGIGRQSRLMLDNLGILVSAEEANQRYADALGKTVDELTDLERKEAFREEALRKMNQQVEVLGGLVLNAADQWRAFRIEIGNAIDRMAGASAQSSFLAEGILNLRAYLRLMIGDVEGAARIMREFADAEAAAGAATIPTSEHFLEQAAAIRELAQVPPAILMPQFEVMKGELRRVGDGVVETTSRLHKLKEEMQEAGPVMLNYNDKAAKGAIVSKLWADEVESLRNQVRGLSADLSAVSGILGFIPGLSGVSRFLGIGSSFLGTVGRFISPDVGGIGGAGAGAVGGANAEVGSTGPVVINVGAAADPMTLARDQQWLRALRESNLNLVAQGA